MPSSLITRKRGIISTTDGTVMTAMNSPNTTERPRNCSLERA